MRRKIKLSSCLSLVAAILASGAAQAQRRTGPAITEIQVTPIVKLAPRCEIVSVWDNIKKQYRNVENGRVVFKMAVTGDASGLVGERSSDANSKPVVNGQDTVSIDPGSELLQFQRADGAPINTGLVIDSQSLAIFQPGPLAYVWTWPTGKASWLTSRWSLNHCNNVPVPPLVKGEKPVKFDPKTIPLAVDPAAGGTAVNPTAGGAAKDPQ